MNPLYAVRKEELKRLRFVDLGSQQDPSCFKSIVLVNDGTVCCSDITFGIVQPLARTKERGRWEGLNGKISGMSRRDGSSTAPHGAWHGTIPYVYDMGLLTWPIWIRSMVLQRTLGESQGIQTRDRFG